MSISYSTHPNAQISVRLSLGKPCTCSGLMYGGVPSIAPGRHSVVVIMTRAPSGPNLVPGATFAKPKSRTFTVPSGVILMLAGFRSR